MFCTIMNGPLRILESPLCNHFPDKRIHHQFTSLVEVIEQNDGHVDRSLEGNFHQFRFVGTLRTNPLGKLARFGQNVRIAS